MIERTLVLMKPDAVDRQLVGRILQRFEDVGLKIVGMKMIQVTKELANKHYLVENFLKGSTVKNTRASYEKRGIKLEKTDEQIASDIQGLLVDFLQELPIISFVLEGPHAIEIVRKLLGGTEPRTALPGTIRGDFFMDSYMVADKKGRPIRNLIHASGNAEEAAYEVALWFPEKELFNYQGMHDKHIK